MTTVQSTKGSKTPAVANRVAVYVRVSSEEQAQGHSLDYQREACHEHAGKLGADNITVYEDAGFSATSSNRPAFLSLIEGAETGQFDTVIVYRLDRFARSRYDSITYKARLIKAGVQLISVTERIEETPSGLLHEGMLELLAEHYSAELSVKVRSGLRKRAEKGLPNAMVPFGYQQSAHPSQDPPTVMDEESKLVRWAYETYASGTAAYTDIADEFNRRGYRTRRRPSRGEAGDGSRDWSGDSIRKLIQNPFYRGAVMHKDDEFPGRHEPIVDEELWRQANRTGRSLRGRAASWKRTHFYPLSGLLKCSGCGNNLQGHYTPSGAGYRYYRETARRRGVACPKPQLSVRADRIEAEIDAFVARLRTPPEVRDQVLEILRDGDDAEDTEVRRQRLREQLKRLSYLYADLAVDEMEYAARKRRLETELAALVVPEERSTEAVEQFDVLQLAWSKASPEEKRSLALALFEAIYFDLDADEIAEIVLQPAFRPWLRDEEPGDPLVPDRAND